MLRKLWRNRLLLSRPQRATRSRWMRGVASIVVVAAAVFMPSLACSDDGPRTAGFPSTPRDAGGMTDDSSSPTLSSDSGAIQEGAVCASLQDSTASCDFSACAPNEICFTKVACGPTADGGLCFQPAGAGEGDNRCHVVCASDEDCDGGRCIAKRFAACTGFDGAPDGRKICVPE